MNQCIPKRVLDVRKCRPLTSAYFERDCLLMPSHQIPPSHPVHQIQCISCTKVVHPKDMANDLFCVRCIEISGPTNQKGLAMSPFIIPSQANHPEIEDAKKILPPIIIPSQENRLKKEEVAKRSMPHFNANGEFIKCRGVHSVSIHCMSISGQVIRKLTRYQEQESPVYTAPPASVSSSTHTPPAAIRLCRRWRHGCAGIIMADASATACSRCLVEGHPLYAPDSSPSKNSPKQPSSKSDPSERPHARQVKKKDFAYMNSSQSRVGHQMPSDAGRIVHSTQPFNVTTTEVRFPILHSSPFFGSDHDIL